MRFSNRSATLLASAALLVLGACSTPLDFDLRGGDSLNTADAARNATAPRPEPDDRGIISYPGYQVAVAQRGDTLSSLAARIGANPQSLARFNGINIDDPLRKGEIIALPDRVTEPYGGPIRPGNVDIASIAGTAIDEVDTSQVATTTLAPSQTGVEPVRHKVVRGETAFTIARLYNVSIRSLAEWNGLGSDFGVREGQFLLIPVALPGEETEPFDATEVTELPGSGSVAPLPPSSDEPLPEEDTVAVADLAKPENQPDDAPDLGSAQTSVSTPSARMSFPVRGDIIREYSKGKSDGIDIAASPGTAVKAADAGVVAAITEDTKGNPIIVVKHADNLLTVYSNVAEVTVSTGDTVRRGQKIAKIGSTGVAAMHFEVRDGFDSVDPMKYLN